MTSGNIIDGKAFATVLRERIGAEVARLKEEALKELSKEKVSKKILV